MDVREKLVELLLQEDDLCERGECKDCFANGSCYYYRVADSLIANGVTVQEWVSVDDELPEVGGYVVCIAKRNPFSRFMPMVARIEKNGWVNPITEQYISEVTHWMPLPEPPKGE